MTKYTTHTIGRITILTYHLGRSTIQGTQADIDRRLAAMGLAVKGGRDE